MHRYLLLALTLALLPGCGGGGGAGQPTPNGPAEVIIVNRTPGLTLTRVLIEAFELGNILNEYSTIDKSVAIGPGFSRTLDQVDVNAFLAAIPGPAGMDTFLFHGVGPLGFAGEDLEWLPGDGSYIVEVIPNPSFPTEPDDEFKVQRLSLEEYALLVATGQVVEL